ncbi:site-specific integrase [Actinoplanes sp. NPDC051851]|uniref:tyrosine-type recombinase/integrase n=1 Tax=Actinoplanes sp. NPDC051851 TaxID=3154753 RepID=UPI0034339872
MTDATVLTGEIVVVPVGASPSAVFASGEQLREVTEAWLENRRLAANTRAAYRWDVYVWLDWCELQGHDPLAVRFTHLNAFGRWLERAVTAEEIDDLPLVKRPAAASTVARRLSAVSSWYEYLLRLSMVTASPAVGVDRPRVDHQHSNTEAFGEADAAALMAAAGADPVLGEGCGAALVAFLVLLGARVSEACAAQLADRGYDDGHHTITLRMKGGKVRVRSMPPGLLTVLNDYLQGRAAATGVEVERLVGALFLRPDGRALDRWTVARFVRRVAIAAGLPNAHRISPHSFRHAFSRIARSKGAPLEDRQDALGHSDPRTTRRYDQAQKRLSADPSYLVYAAVDQGL